MKRIFLLLAAVAVSMIMAADNVTSEQAEQIAIQFLNSHRPSGRKQIKMAKRQPLDVKIASDASAYYVFNVGAEDGYVVVSGSDLAPQVLAYSEKGAFGEEIVPPNMQAWLDGYADQIAYLERTDGKNEAPRLPVQRKAVSPLLTSKWGQGYPYNIKCPTHPTAGERCVTGCVATALAQVINYYKFPSQTKAVIPAYTSSSAPPGYSTPTCVVNMPAVGITSIDWNNMLDDYSNSSTVAQRNAVAELMLLCGQAVKMNYGISALEGGSGSDTRYDVAALQRYFGFDGTVRALDRNAFGTSEWENIIYEEIAAGRPVLYGGQSSGGGHAFVIDGCNNDGLFHVNWGWEGNCDAYFALSILNPHNNSGTGASSSDDGYSFGQNAVIGIQHGTEEILPELFTVYGIRNAGSSTFTRSSASEDFTGISILTTVYNMTGDIHSFYLGLALVDADENWVSTPFNMVSYGSQDYEHGGPYMFKDCAFGADLPNGDYYIIPVSASENSEIWEPCWRSNVYRIKAAIRGKKLTLTEPSVDLSATMQATGLAMVGESLSITAQITNNGSYFNDYVYLFEDGRQVGGRMFEAGEGQTSSFEIDYVPLSSGQKALTLATYDEDPLASYEKYEDRFLPFSDATVNIARYLSYSISVQNATNGIVAGGKVVAKVCVTNNGENYDNDVLLRLFKISGRDYSFIEKQSKPLTLTSGSTTTLDFEFDNLEAEQDYLLSFMYIKAGTGIDDGDYVLFSTKVSDLKLTLSASPNGGTISYMQEVTLTASKSNAEIYCTFDGTEPTQNDFFYDPPFYIDRNLTLKAKAFLDGYEPSETLTRTFQVKLDIAASRASGNVRAGETVTLSCTNPEATIYYTTDGTTPTKASNIYASPIRIDNSVTIKAIAMHDECLSSDVLTRNYVVSKVKLSVSPSGGTVQKGTTVSITSNPADADIFYTLDGSEPTVMSNMYEGTPIAIQKNTTLKALAYADGYAESNILSADYFVKLTLQASLASGTVDYQSEVTLTSNAPEATIYYTTDGSTPTQESPVYRTPIIVEDNMVVKAIAMHNDYLASDVLTRNYAIRTVTLSASPANSDRLTAGTEITLTAKPADAAIYYTTDGSEPIMSSSLYTAPIIARSNFTLKAVGFYDGYKPSDVLEIDYSVAPEPTTILVSPDEQELLIGRTLQLTYSFIPEDAKTMSLTWESSDTEIASVNQQGLVTAKKEGAARIMARAANNVFGYCDVTVCPPPSGISISEQSLQLHIDDETALSYSVLPANAIYSVSWKSSSPSVATVSDEGVVKALAQGTTNITASTNNGLSATCKVSVYPRPSDISLNKTSLNLIVGETDSLICTISPSNALYTVSWSSDAPGVVSVIDGRVEAKKGGIAHITVTTDNGLAATCEVTVPPEPRTVNITPKELELIDGRSSQLTYSFTPDNAATLSLTWESSDTDVAIINQEGVVRALRPGHATLTATTRNGVVGKCELTVPMPLFQLFVWTKAGIKTGYLSTDEPQFSVEGDIVHFTTSLLSMDIHRDTLDKFTLERVLPEHPKSIRMSKDMMIPLGQSEQLSVTLRPLNARTKLTWFNDNPEVVSVTQEGFVTALQPGVANILVQTSNGLHANCRVRVPEPFLRFFVWLRNGEIHGYDLEEHPEVTFGEKVFTLTSSRQTVQYNAADVLRFTLQDEALVDGVSLPEKVTNGGAQFREGMLFIAGSRPNSPVQVYDTTGRLVQTAMTDGEGNLTLSLDGLRANIYIIRTEQTTIKIQKR